MQKKHKSTFRIYYLFGKQSTNHNRYDLVINHNLIMNILIQNRSRMTTTWSQKESRTSNTNVNEVEVNAESNSTSRNHKQNFSFNTMSLQYPYK